MNDELKISTRNVQTCGRTVLIIFVGDVLFFGGSIQKYYEVTDVIGSRPYSNGVDLFQMWKDSGELPILMEKI